MKTTTLRPGLLVSLKTSVTGGVAYKRIDLDPEHPVADGAVESRWETTKVVEDAAEFERASKLRGKCRSMIASVCAASDFGLLCPSDRQKDLDAAIVEARNLADEFNADAVRSMVNVYVVAGRIAQDDEEAIRAINGEVRDLLEAMKAGVAAADVETIREAASKARQLGRMLTETAGEKVSAAIEQARSAAREIVKRVQKDGENTAVVVSQLKLDAIESARFAFLDLDDARHVEPTAPVAPVVELLE